MLQTELRSLAATIFVAVIVLVHGEDSPSTQAGGPVDVDPARDLGQVPAARAPIPTGQELPFLARVRKQLLRNGQAATDAAAADVASVARSNK